MRKVSSLPKREFLQLAQVYDPTKHSIGGWFASEKLDGVRCYWDGGATRGLKIEDVPFANLASNDIRVEQQYATGLWSRYGHPYQAPDWFLDLLPPFNLDGELYLGLGKFQETISIVKRLQPDDRWRQMKYMVFDAPATACVFQVGEINNPNYSKVYGTDISDWMFARSKKWVPDRQFMSTLFWLGKVLPESPHLQVHEQIQLPYQESKARDAIDQMLGEVLEKKGEGLIVRSGSSTWTPKRTGNVLKVKDKRDAECEIVGYKSAEFGKLHGKIGSFTVRYAGVTFNLSGFTDEEREYATADAKDWALNHPGQDTPARYEAKKFKRGDKLTFTYASLTQDGVPREARYLRKRVD